MSLGKRGYQAGASRVGRGKDPAVRKHCLTRSSLQGKTLPVAGVGSQLQALAIVRNEDEHQPPGTTPLRAQSLTDWRPPSKAGSRWDGLAYGDFGQPGCYRQG